MKTSEGSKLRERRKTPVMPPTGSLRSLALLFVGTADASLRRLQSPYTIECHSGQESPKCDNNCVYPQCGCDEYPTNSSSCCTRANPCDSDEEDKDGFTMGSILRQVWFIFIVMGVISTIIWRRPAYHRVRFPPPCVAALPPFPLCSPLHAVSSRFITHHTTAFGVGRRLRQRRMLMAEHQATLPHPVAFPSHPTPHHP